MRTALLLVLAALGLLLAMACGSGGKGDRTASVIHRLLLAGGTNDTSSLESFPGKLPDGLPLKPPLYPGADLIVSSRQPAPLGQGVTPEPAQPGKPQPLLYFIVLDTDASRNDVFTFYEKELDKDPWEIVSNFSTPDLDTLQFDDVSDPDIAGAVSIAHGGGDNRTTILISLQDSGALLDKQPPFELAKSLPVPKEFPSDVPLYEGLTVTSSAFFRQAQSQSFLLIFLTKDSKQQVIDFYRGKLEARGWAVTDRQPVGTEQRIEWQDDKGDIAGSVQADAFARSGDYTEVRIQISQNPAREPVTGDATPRPTAKATPAATKTPVPAQTPAN